MPNSSTCSNNVIIHFWVYPLHQNFPSAGEQKKNTNMTESFLEIQTNFDRNFLSKIFLDIFPALVCSHNLSYCYFLYFLFPVFKLYGESEVTAKKHRNITYIRTVKCCFLALCTVQHTFMPVFSSLIVITAKNYQAYFVV